MTKPEGEIDADIARLEQDRHWQSSKSCAGANPRAARQVCAQIFGLEAELARAQATGVLRARIDILKEEIKSLGGLRWGQPQASVGEAQHETLCRFGCLGQRDFGMHHG